MNKLKTLMKKSKFWKIYVYAVASFLCLLVIGLIVFTIWLADYESSQNTIAVDKVLSMFEEKQYSEIAEKTDVVMTGFADRAVYEAKLKEAAEGKKITYVKAFSYDRFASPSYIIKADDKDLCKVTLKKSAKTSKFGFSLYEFDYVSDFSFSNIKVVFLSPEGAVPYLDGKPVGEVFRKTLAKDQPSASKYTLTSDPLVIHRYEIAGLLTQPESVDVKWADGTGCTLSRNSQNEIVAEALDVTIHAPSGFKVTVNGAVLGEKYITDHSKENEYIKYLLNEADQNQMSLFDTYQVEQLTKKPEVTVQDKNGNPVPCTYNAESKTFDVGFQVYTFRLPSNYQVVVNGKEITNSKTWLIEENVGIEELKNIPEDSFTKPVLNVYKVAVLSGDLTIEAKNYAGEPVTLSYEEAGMQYTGDFAVADSRKDTYMNLAVEGAKKYSNFMSNDLSKGAFLSQIIKSSRMYQDMMEYRQEFYTDHDSTKFENVEAYDLKVYGERCFSCAVYFDYWIYGQRGKPDFQQKL